jgi:hypothetical protein
LSDIVDQGKEPRNPGLEGMSQSHSPDLGKLLKLQ